MRKEMIWALIFMFVMVAGPASAYNKDEFAGVRAGVLVHAEPKLVYNAIRNQRIDNASAGRELSRAEFELLIEEEFNGLPIVGHAWCTYREMYTPYKKVDYKMVKSDKFKAFEGSWELKSENDGKDTYLQLSGYVDTGLAIPFGRQITNIQTSKDVKRRLQFVKRSAEAANKLNSAMFNVVQQ